MLKIFLRLRVYLFYIWSTSTRKTSLGRTVVCELSMNYCTVVCELYVCCHRVVDVLSMRFVDVFVYESCR